MADTLQKAIAGSVAQSSSNARDDAEHCANRYYTAQFDFEPGEAAELLIAVPQTNIALKAAYVVPALTLAKHATNYVTLTLGKGNLANGSLTSFDTMDTDSNGDDTALTISTKRSFTIVPSTDALDKGDGLYLHIAHAATTANNVKGTVVVEYELDG